MNSCSQEAGPGPLAGEALLPCCPSKQELRLQGAQRSQGKKGSLRFTHSPAHQRPPEWAVTSPGSHSRWDSTSWTLPTFCLPLAPGPLGWGVSQAWPNAPLGYGPERPMSPSPANKTPRLWGSAPFPSSGGRLWTWQPAHIPACLPLHSSHQGRAQQLLPRMPVTKSLSHHPPYSCHPGRPCL